ncbi:hypothetical protein D3C73_1571010 [compost metagenome]
MQVKDIQSGIKNLEMTIDELFLRQKDQSAYLPIPDPQQPILWTLGMGAIIISVLTFAGWRMFLSRQNVVPVKHKNEA